MKTIPKSIQLNKVKALTLSESAEQSLLFKWAEWNHQAYPELFLLHHIPNGGRRDIVTATHLKAEGVKAGVPDICLPVARFKWHGLYIEMKVGDNKPSDNQLDWIDKLRRQGYKVNVCYGWEQASEVIMAYLKSDQN